MADTPNIPTDLIKDKLSEIDNQISNIKIEKDKIQKVFDNAIKNTKISKTLGMILSYIETLLVFFMLYIIPIPLLFIDKYFILNIGKDICNFYIANSDAVIWIYGLINLVFIGKTFSKTLEGKANEVLKRQNFGKELAMFIGIAVFALHLIAYPIINIFVPFLSDYVKGMTITTVGFVFSVASLYIGNKLVFAFNKDSLFQQISDTLKENNETDKPADGETK